jgi:hypothetical protein
VVKAFWRCEERLSEDGSAQPAVWQFVNIDRELMGFRTLRPTRGYSEESHVNERWGEVVTLLLVEVLVNEIFCR